MFPEDDEKTAAERNGSIPLNKLVALPTVVTHEVLSLIESKVLYSRGVGSIDAHFLASTLITPDTQSWTADKRLQIAAGELEIAYSSHEQ